MEKIDIVIDWVDGSDPEWRRQKAQYMPQTEAEQQNSGETSNRYRDWDLMKFWFRGIEKYAPWVNHIYLVTCGHYPKWLNLNHPKLTLVKHSDYIPAEYLPTFNSNVIEMYLHKIRGLSERFILFNDDMFVISPTTVEDFFQNGLPKEKAVLDVLHQPEPGDVFPATLLNVFGIINKYFSKKEVVRKNFRKFFYPGYGKEMIFNMILYPFVYFSSFRDSHLTSAMLKSTYEEIWEKEPEILGEMMKHRFRSKDDCMQWMFKYWQICQGKFEPQRLDWGRKYELGQDDSLFRDIARQKYKVICINDSDPCIDFTAMQKKLQQSFSSILPDKSEYEL